MLQKFLQRAPLRYWRLLLAATLSPFAVNAFLNSGWMTHAFGPSGEELWDFFCLSIALAGLGIRTVTAGFGQGTDHERNSWADKLHVTGFYSVIRHPTYLANFLFLCSGILLLKSVLLTILVVIVAYLYYGPLVLMKERSLLERHGDAYGAWADRTPAILPNFSAWKTPTQAFDLKLAIRREAVTFALVGLMFFTIEALEAVLIEKDDFIQWLLRELHWLIVLVIGLAIVWSQLSRVWSTLLFVMSSVAISGTSIHRTMVNAPDHREEALNALAAGGHVLLLRHGSTVGRDLEKVRPTDCVTQRNLGEKGREEARELGALLRARGVNLAKVISSEYCRCQETAALIGALRIETSPDLNEKHMHVTLVERIVGNFDADEALLRPVRSIIAGWKGHGTLLLVSHAPNIAGLTFEDVRPAEGLVLQPAPSNPLGFTIVGKITKH